MTSKLQDISKSKKKYINLGERESVLHKEPLINAAYSIINAAYFITAQDFDNISSNTSHCLFWKGLLTSSTDPP